MIGFGLIIIIILLMDIGYTLGRIRDRLEKR